MSHQLVMACIKARGQPSTVMLVSCGGLWSYGRFDLARVHWEVGPPPLWSERLDGRATHLLRALLPRLVSRQAVRVRGLFADRVLGRGLLCHLTFGWVPLVEQMVGQVRQRFRG